MDAYKGIIIEESLQDVSVLDKMTIIKTEVEKTTAEHQSSVSQWTMHTVEIPADKAPSLVIELERAMASTGTWYIDFKNNLFHYIIFKDKVFFIDRSNISQYDEARAYGLSLGFPVQQLDFHPNFAGK